MKFLTTLLSQMELVPCEVQLEEKKEAGLKESKLNAGPDKSLSLVLLYGGTHVFKS